MFDLGMRYLRQITTEKRMTESRKERQLSLWVKDAASKQALIDYSATASPLPLPA